MEFDQEGIDTRVGLRQKFPAAFNYLVSIFLIQRDYGRVQNSKLAERLGVSQSAVNQAVGRMKKLNLVEQSPYGDISLTPEGLECASITLKKHYLIEYLLIKTLNYPWELSDQEAGRLQESISDEFADYLYHFYGEPQTCPHGNPFPQAPLEPRLVRALRLTEVPRGHRVTLVRITEEGEASGGLLSFCGRHRLYPGVELRVLEIHDTHITVALEDTTTKTLEIPLSIGTFLCCEDKTYKKIISSQFIP